MDSLTKEQAFDAIYMAILLGHINSARHAFYEILKLTRLEMIDGFIDLALKNGANNLVKDIKKMKSIQK